MPGNLPLTTQTSFVMDRNILFKAILISLVASSLAESEPDLGHHRFEPIHHQIDTQIDIQEALLEPIHHQINTQEAQVEIEALSDPDAVNPNVDNFYLNPYAKRNLSEMTLHEFRSKKEQIQLTPTWTTST